MSYLIKHNHGTVHPGGLWVLTGHAGFILSGETIVNARAASVSKAFRIEFFLVTHYLCILLKVRYNVDVSFYQ